MIHTRKVVHGPSGRPFPQLPPPHASDLSATGYQHGQISSARLHTTCSLSVDSLLILLQQIAGV